MRRALALGAAMVLALTLAVAPAEAAPAKWTTEVFATVPSPGFPAYVLAHRNGRVYTGTYVNSAATGIPSRVYEWSRGGQLLRSWPVPGQVLDGTQGIQVANQTHDGKLVVLETSTRSVLTLGLRTGKWHRVATFPEGAVPNYATWGPGGALFVSDYHQPVIWRIAPGSRAPEQWFTSDALNGTEFGTTGLRYRPFRHDLVIGQQAVLDGSQPPVDGALYSLPVRPDGGPGALTKLWESGPLALPDGFGIGRSGHLYVALVGTNQVVELTATGEEVDRYPDVPLSGDNGTAIPFDTPSSATFLGTRVLVANQSAVAGDATHQAILAVEVGERGRAPYLPKSARFGKRS